VAKGGGGGGMDTRLFARGAIGEGSIFGWRTSGCGGNDTLACGAAGMGSRGEEWSSTTPLAAAMTASIAMAPDGVMAAATPGNLVTSLNVGFLILSVKKVRLLSVGASRSG
jgi:hypothetical protein